ncbi:hypothetical protein Tco_0331244 [Tanacetum coccineum]
MAFVSSLINNTSSSNEAVNVAHGVTAASTQVNTAYSTNIDNLSDAVIYSFFASQPNSPQLAHEDLQQIHPKDIEEKDLRWVAEAPRIQDNKNKESSRMRLLLCCGKQLLYSFGVMLMVLVDMTGVYKCSWQRKGLIMHSWLTHLQVQTQRFRIVDNCKKGLGYNVVPPPYTGNFMPPTPDLSFTGLDEFVNEPVVENNKAMSSEEERA